MKFFEGFNWEVAIGVSLLLFAMFIFVFTICIACVTANVWFLLMWLFIIPIAAYGAGSGWFDE